MPRQAGEEDEGRTAKDEDEEALGHGKARLSTFGVQDAGGPGPVEEQRGEIEAQAVAEGQSCPEEAGEGAEVERLPTRWHEWQPRRG